MRPTWSRRHERSMVPQGDTPGENEDPLFGLLDDDERIVDLRVSVERFLAAPDDRSVDVSLFVKTRPTYVMYADLALS